MKQKIYERNPQTGVIRWRYFGEDSEKYGWPNYGNILKEKEWLNGMERVDLLMTNIEKDMMLYLERKDQKK